MKELSRKILFFLCLFATAVIGSSLIPNVSAAQVENSSVIFSRNLTIGDFGGDVLSLQAMLIAENSLDISAPTGYFGTLTAAAVASWQTSVGLPSTGYFGPLSRAEIDGQTVAVAPTPPPIPTFISTPILPLTTTTSSSITYSRNLAIGDSGSDVASLQSTLISKGYLQIAAPTGYFGSMTAAAVAKWQAATDIPATGYFGPLTRANMEAFVSNLITPVANAAMIPSTTVSTPMSLTTTPTFSGGGGSGGGGGSALPISVSSPSTPPQNNRDTIAPSIPSKLSSVITTSTISLSWSASTDNIGVLGYQIFRNGTQIATTSANSYKNSGLSPATSYSYTISAFDSAGNISSQSAVTDLNTLQITMPPPAPTPPSIPQQLTITKTTASTVSLSWSTSIESNGTIAGYELYRNNAKLVSTTQTSFTNIALVPNTSYQYSVTAYDTKGISSPTSAAVTATTQALPPPPPPPLNNNFGISVGSGFLSLNSATQNQELNSMVSLGVGWLRFDIQWKVVQAKNSSSFNWSQIDSLVSEANAHHLKVLAILDYAPAWAAGSCSGGTNCPPASPTTFAAFAKAAVQRYASEGVTDYEIWNEPNNASFWGGKSDCATYTADLKAAYTAIKQVDSSAGVITGGLAPESTDGSNIAPTEFLTCIYNDGGKGYFDAVGDHPYTFPQMPSAISLGAWGQMFTTTPSLRSIMVANGDGGKRIWVTEFGAPTDGPENSEYVSEAQQANMMTDAFQSYPTSSWAGPFFWYTLEDTDTSTSTNENFFGLLRIDGSKKPAFMALQNIILSGL